MAPPEHRTSATLNLVGAGRVAQTLASLWHAQRCFVIQDVLTTSLTSAQAACAVVGSGQPVAALQDLRPAAVWMLAVPDAQIGAAAKAMATHFQHLQAVQPVVAGDVDTQTPIVFHCSGAHSVAVLEPLAALGWHVASAHCILSFTTVATALAQFPGTPCALEGDAQACAVLRPAFTTIGARCFDIASADKLLYHAAAVFATNFLPVLQDRAEALWQTTGMPAELIPALREKLLRHAVTNITMLGPKAALTGPAARGDTAAIARQGAAVAQWDAQTGAAYHSLSELALRLAQGKSH